MNNNIKSDDIDVKENIIIQDQDNNKENDNITNEKIPEDEKYEFNIYSNKKNDIKNELLNNNNIYENNDINNINNLNTNKIDEKNNLINASKTSSDIIQNEGIESNVITNKSKEKLEENEQKEVNYIENNIENYNVNDNIINTFGDKKQEEEEINTELKNQKQIIEIKENEIRNKDDKNLFEINNEELSTFKQDNSLNNKIRISKLLRKQDELTLFEIMDESSFVNFDINYPVIPKIIFTEEELDGENEKNLNNLLKLPDFMIGDIGNSKKAKKLKTAYTPQKIKIKNPIFANKNNNMKQDGKGFNLDKMNLKNLNIYKSKNKNKAYLKKYNNINRINDNLDDDDNINNHFDDYNNILKMNKNNLNYLTGINCKNSNVFIKKNPKKVNNIIEKNNIGEDINNINNCK